MINSFCSKSAAALMLLAPLSLSAAEPLVVDQMISTGDNHYLSNSVPVDSPASIEATFAFFQDVFHTKRIYWRGLQEAAWAETMLVRQENFRYATFHKWSRHLINDLKIEKLAVDIAHAKGMELWGIASLGDWGSPADTPGFNDFPFNCESKLRLEHPEWAPVDKYGYRRQGGTIELAYPEARKALVDLHVRLAKEAGYDGVMFLTYVENFSLRFQDEFGYSEPIVQEFKKRYGIDIRQEEFTRYASLYDWRKLRGEYATAFFAELRAALKAEGMEFGVFLNPQDIRKPLIWATLPFDYQTIGNIHMDVDAWVRDGLVDRLLVWGGCAPARQVRTIDEVVWLTRGTDITVGALTSNPFKGLAGVNPKVERVATLHDEVAYLSRSPIPEQTEKALADGTIYEKMKFLAQVVEGKSVCPVDKVIPLAASPNLLLRRLALQALGVSRDAKAVPTIEAALFDPEVGVRGAAMSALSTNHRPETIQAILKAVEKDPTHPLGEMARTTVPRLQPPPYAELLKAIQSSSIPEVRIIALRSLGLMTVPVGERDAVVDTLIKALSDSSPYARYSAAMSLASFRSSPKAIEALIETLKSPDAPTADRAALSLGEMVQAGYDGDLKPQILAGLKGLFRQFGDGTQRSDHEWGHRSVGNALLAFGGEGRTALEEWLSQDQDQRLAEMAWQVLYFKEKGGDNRFNVISEKENEDAYRARPAHMKRLLVGKISQDFELSGISEGSFGDAEKPIGRWSALGPKGQFLEQKMAHSGTQSIRLARTGGAFLGRVIHGVLEGSEYQAGLWVRRSPGGAMVFSVQDRKGAASVALRVDASGKVFYQNTGNPAWAATDLSVEENRWTELAVRAVPRKGICLIAVDPKGEDDWKNAVRVPLLPAGSVDRVILNATSDEPEVVLIDDVTLVERR